MNAGLLASVFVTAACGPALPPLPAQGGPPWRELVSEHFVVWTDSTPEHARELVREMEHLRQVEVGAVFRAAAGPGRAFVIAPRDSAELHEFLSSQFGAIAFPSTNALHQAFAVLPAATFASDEDRVAAHELTHVISYAFIHHQPRWFAEGMAKFLETIDIDEKNGVVDLGREPTQRGPGRMVIHRLVSLAKMFQCAELRCADVAFYATAWAFFTYLVNTHTAELDRYIDLLAKDTEPQHAWDQVFAGVDLEQLDADMRRWLTTGKHVVVHLKVAFAEVPIAERMLTDADVYAVRAVMRFHLRSGHDAMKDVRAALALDANNVLAHVIGYEVTHQIDAGAARATASAHPDDWRAWWLVAAAVRTGDEAIAARDKACTLAHANPAVVPPFACK
jgi:hypothetical protein